MKKTIIIIPFLLLLLGGFLYQSDHFEQVNKADEIALYQCIKQFPLKFSLTERTRGTVRLKEYTDNITAYFSGTDIDEIPEYILKNMSCVQAIELNENKLSAIPTGIRYLPELTRISFLNNRIQSIPDSTFKYNPNLNRIDLSLNQIKVLHLNAFKSIRSIDLGNNEIKKIFPVFDAQSDIRYLELNSNSLTTVDLNAFRSVRHLNLSRNHAMDILPVHQQEKSELRSLNLSNNELMRFPKALFSLQSLNKLDLSNNFVGLDLKFNELPFEKLTAITELNLVKNNFIQFPTGLGKIPNLTRLNLKNNHFKGAVILNGFNKLTNLSIKGKSIESFTIEANSLRRLSILDFTDNKLLFFEIKEENHQLQTLNLSSNQLSDLPSSINQLSALEFLNLENNKIRKLPKLNGLNKLKRLNLSDNSLIEIPAKEQFNIDSMGRLTLVLSNNSITALDFERIYDNIEVLNLANNNIVNIKNLAQLPNLKELSLSGNPNLKQFPIEILDYLINLSKLDLTKTSIDPITLFQIDQITKRKGIKFIY